MKKRGDDEQKPVSKRLFVAASLQKQELKSPMATA
jgi:hypothetical protein